MLNSTPPNSKQNKDKRIKELNLVYDAFFNKPLTMKEVDKLTGVMRESICWYCKALRESNRLYKVRKRRCTVTKYNDVWEWTTNPDLKPENNQLELF